MATYKCEETKPEKVGVYRAYYGGKEYGGDSYHLRRWDGEKWTLANGAECFFGVDEDEWEEIE